MRKPIPDAERCETVFVQYVGNWPHDYRCERWATQTVEGHRFCTQHAAKALTSGEIRVIDPGKDARHSWDIASHYLKITLDPELVAKKEAEDAKKLWDWEAKHNQDQKMRRIARFLAQRYGHADLLSLHPREIDAALAKIDLETDVPSLAP